MNEEKLIQTIEALASQNFKLQAQLLAFKEAFARLSEGVTHRSWDELWDALDDSERYWHQWMLEHLESQSPAAAAIVDRRDASSIWLPPEDYLPPSPSSPRA